MQVPVFGPASGIFGDRMTNFVSGTVFVLLATGLLLSCASAPPVDRPLTAEERDSVIGNVDAEFTVNMGSSRDVIMATAHVRLLERARLLYGGNVEIRNVEITRRAALGAALMHGEDTIVARGVVISLDMQTARARAGTIEHALMEIRRVLPVDARLWIHNGATTDRNLANDTADDITAAFIRDNVTVVERGLIDLIATEQGIHLDGTVADSDFISIGNAAGANTIIVVAIAGTGVLRRLNVRVLDIATGTVRMQSDTGEAWRL